MFLMLIPLLIIITLEPERLECSLVMDEPSQHGLHVSNYCPRIRGCKEGTHVACMYYDPKRKYGPRCRDSINITINAVIANQLLEIANTIRSKIANGVETGKDGKRLPRGYGIMRLKWDNELATFAQMLANQCILRHDMCRATTKFAEPEQIIVIVRFFYPNWMPNKDGPKDNRFSPGLPTNPKLMYSVTQGTRSWYIHRTYVTEQMVKSYPDYTATPTNTSGKLYLDLVHGPTTHMGCGMSGYTAYDYYKHEVFNTVQIVCNFSARTKKGTAVYETSPPNGKTGYSPKCGCPPGTREDFECLCNEIAIERNCNYAENGNCEPTLVLLPIFTMEDAPSDKLYEIAEDIKDPLKDFILQRVNNSDNIDFNDRFKQELSEDAFDFLHDKDYENDIGFTPQTRMSSYKNNHRSRAYLSPDSKPPPPHPPPPLPPPRRPPHRPPPKRPRVSRYQTRHSPPRIPPRIPPPPPPPPKDEYNTELKIHEDPILASCDEKRTRPLPRLPTKYRPVTKKASIFTKIPQFQLPQSRRMSSQSENVKSNSKQRRINSNSNKVVNDYEHRAMTEHKTFDEHKEQNELKGKTKHRIEDMTETGVVTETGLNKAEEVVINFNQDLKQKNYTKYNDKDIDIKDDNDNKLLTLLDNLEQEVKHVALDGNERELFDVKLRKIYGTVIGKTAAIQFPKPFLLNTARAEEPEIEFGETKSVDKVERKHGDDKVVHEPIKRAKHHPTVKNVAVRSYGYLGHHRKNKLDDSYVSVKPNEVYDHIYNDNFDDSYGDMDYKYMSDGHKYNENFNKKKSDNILDYEHKDVQHKFNENYNHQHHYHLKKHNDDIPASMKKFEVTKAVFREFGNSNEETPKISARHLSANEGISDRKGLIAKDIEKIKRTERIHRNKAKSLNSHINFDDPLDFERRKYYQDRLYSIRKKLRSRKNRRDSSNDRSRRTHSKNRESSRTKSKPDNFYVPERPGFLHGF